MNAWAIALDSIWHHKLRSALTALGIVIGVFAVVTLTSLGTSVKTYISDQFNGIGADVITVSPASAHSTSGGRHGRAGGAFRAAPSTLTVADAQAIAGLTADHVQAAAPVALAIAQVSVGSNTDPNASILGTSPSYFTIEHLQFAAGGAPSGSGPSIVLGHAAAHSLFGSTSAIGQTVTVGTTSYTVFGVLQPSGSIIGGNPDQTVYIPVANALALAGTTYVSEIVAAADTSAQVPGAAAAVKALMGQRHPLNDFSVITAGQILSTINSTLSVITSVLAGIAAISLIVGGIGIMNIMLVTVTERIREIGTRKALGARNSDILVQFLVEAVLLAVLGGAIGTGLSALASRIVGHIIKFPIGLTLSSVIAALAFSIGVGVIFGVLPAMNAARLMPAEALRSE